MGKAPWVGSILLPFGCSEPSLGAWCGGSPARALLSPQTGNVSAVIDVKSGYIVGDLKVGRYGLGAAKGAWGCFWALGTEVMWGDPRIWTWCGGDGLGLEEAGSMWPSMGGKCPLHWDTATAPLLSLCRLKLSLKHSDVGTFQVNHP